MKILLDHCVPKRFRTLLSGHEVRTAFEMRWHELTNGRLLAAMASQFELLVTIDQRMQFERNLGSLPVSVLIVVAPNNLFETIRRVEPFLSAALPSSAERVLIRLFLDGRIERVVPPSSR